MEIAIGIDVHKVNCAVYAVFAGKNEPTPKQERFLEKFNEKYRRVPSDMVGMTDIAKAVSGHAVHVLIENSTKSHDIYWMLKNLGIDVTVAHATDLYNITMSPTKTDDNDARELAAYMRRRLMGEVEFAESHIPDRDVLELRELCRLSLDYRSDLCEHKKLIRSHLLIRGIKLTREYNDIASVQALKEIDAYPWTIFKMDVHRAVGLKKEIQFLDKVLRQRFDGNRVFEIVWSVPGFGVLSAAYMACMIDDPSRFPDGKSLSAAIGLTPKLRESADKPKNCGISRRGDADLRRLVTQATFVHVFHAESQVTEKYRRLKSKGKSHNETLVACANSMVRMVWVLLRDNRMYSERTDVLSKARAMADATDLEDRMEVEED